MCRAGPGLSSPCRACVAVQQQGCEGAAGIGRRSGVGPRQAYNYARVGALTRQGTSHCPVQDPVPKWIPAAKLLNDLALLAKKGCSGGNRVWVGCERTAGGVRTAMLERATSSEARRTFREAFCVRANAAACAGRGFPFRVQTHR
eukprot:scaffold7601_cov417-Prasinococcus_capsulatus_cf.AAC.5